MTKTYRRIVALAVAGILAAALGAGLAFARPTAAPIGSGVAVIETNLGYQGGAAAGTGIVLTKSGEVLTNNHVIRGATQVRIVLPGTGRSYSAKVLGYSVTNDVALLQASGASNLKTSTLDTSTRLATGQTVTALGNAGGTGSFTSSTGQITGLGRSITVGDEQGGSQRLSGLIETNAHLQPGDSGGPLLNKARKVIGMNTAASTGSEFGFASAQSDGYAIPIRKARTIASQIEAGKSSATVHIGGTAFLGVEIDTSYGGALIAGVLTGGPADAAGLVEGDVITAIDGQAVSTPNAIASLLLSEKPGQHVTVSFVDQSGVAGTASVVLGSGPPQ
ncbi:MAG TPA: trypsin-like peptidase domain-containing protein [Gaiellaceae bacterium]|jgi:S1-C subfamily serine protease